MGKRGDAFVEKWNSVYFLIPVFEKPVVMPSFEEFQAAMEKKFGKVEVMSKEQRMPAKEEDMLSFALWDHCAEKEGEIPHPSQLLLYGAGEFDQGIWDEGIVAQFWCCGSEREKFAERCRYSIMASNMMAALLPVMEQYGIMADYADLLLELFPDCIGIYWPHSQNLVPREYFQEQHWNSPELHFMDGGLQVPFYNISNSDEMLFDTLGLTTIGLPDLQLHCKDLNPNDAVHFLRNLAVYMYCNGDVIDDGNTVEGIDGGKWVCQREDAMAGPMRMVLDVHAGKYAGGGR